MYDHEVFKNVMKEAVETMDVWNTWDKDVIETLAKEKNLHQQIELK